MKFTIVAVSAPALRQMLRFKKKYEKTNPEDRLELQCFYIAGMEQKYILNPDIIRNSIEEADVVVVDTMGASEELQAIVRQGLERCNGQRIVMGNTLREYLRLGAFSMEINGAKAGMGGKPEEECRRSKSCGSMGESEADMTEAGGAMAKMHRMRRMAMMLGSVLPLGITKDMKNIFLLMDYWQQATEKDIESFMLLVLRRYGGRKHLPKEKSCTMQYGIYLKDPFTLECYETAGKYMKQSVPDKKKNTIAVMFYGHSYPNDFLPVVRATCEKLKENYNILPIAFSQNEDKDLDKLREYLCPRKNSTLKYRVAAIVNFMPFNLGAGPMGGDANRAVEILKVLNVPYLKPFCLTKNNEEEWERSHGVTPGEFLINILLPEMDGGILTNPVGLTGSLEDKGELSLPETVPIQERIDSLSQRLEKLLELRRLGNSQKKLAFIFYNYPPGEDNVFGGAFLDTLGSVSHLLKSLKYEGYTVNEMSPEALENAFVSQGNCNMPQWCEEKNAEIICNMAGKDYPIKGIINGNVFLGLQPVREHSDLGSDTLDSYHDRNQRPSEEYRAFYQWIKKEFRGDALIHFGTHGTLEFLWGKETGMTAKCWPDKLVGDIPHFYYYYIGNPSEAMIAKRRSMATIISYQAPQLKKSGLYGKYIELKEMIGEYRESLQSAPERSGDLLDSIGEQSKLCGFEEAYGHGTDALDEKLYEYENSLITDGMHVINEDELTGLLRGLRGEYIPVGPAGDVVKNPDILPSGRNLVQFDPRLIPTKTAYRRGVKAAQLAVERYHKEKGRYPETTAVILWGLETSRSQGETLGQILYYLGLRLKTDKSSYDNKMEIIPLEDLERPRMDVIIHICGFFREMYSNLMDNLNEILQQILKLKEPDEKNYFSRNTKKMAEQIMEESLYRGKAMDENEAWELASCRIFGPKEGEYATRLTDVVRMGSWQEASRLGSAFAEDLSYGYSYRHRGRKAKDMLKKQYCQVDFISQIRNNVEYELTDVDHYYEFYGGLSKAVEAQKGEKPVMLVADTTGEGVKVQSIKEVLDRGIATRLLNPEWIEGMMRHRYHGVREIAKRFENVMGFAATTDAISSETFSKMARCYAGNEELRQKLRESNKWAYMKMMERLMEANNRGYYEATEEEVMQIQGAYLEAEGEAEE